MSNTNGAKWISKERRLSILMRDGFSCVYCGRDLHPAAPAEVTLDHLLPRCKGGGNENENLVTACRSCSSARGTTHPKNFTFGGAVERIYHLRFTPTNPELAKAIIRGDVGDPEVEALR